MDEKVLCIPARKIVPVLENLALYYETESKFFPSSILPLYEIIYSIIRRSTPQGGLFVPRSLCEEDVNLRQLVNYSVVNVGGKLFSYLRGKKGGEARLHAKRSIGVGGHINDTDFYNDARVEGAPGSLINEASLMKASMREINEEIEYNPLSKLRNLPPKITYRGLICDLKPEKEVDAVHAGLVYEIEYSPGYITQKCDSIEDPKLCPLWYASTELEFENWSQILMSVLFEPDVSFFSQSIERFVSKQQDTL